MIFKDVFILESASIDEYKRLRDVIMWLIHGLGKDEWMSLSDLSKKLSEYKINTSEKILKKFFEDWENDKYYLFEPHDDEWLFYDKENNIVFSTKHFDKPPTLGKSRRDIEEREKSTIYKKTKDKTVDRTKVPLVCPIPSDILMRSFKLYSSDKEAEIFTIKRFIHKAITTGIIENNYESVWNYMIENVPKDIKDGGLGIELKRGYKKYELSSGWVSPRDKDLDIGVPVVHVKYGYGYIDDIPKYSGRNTLEIKFLNDKGLYEMKKLNKDSVLENNSIRIPKNYVKKDSDLKGYEILNNSKSSNGDVVYHKRRGEGVIDNYPSYANKEIKVKFKSNISKVVVFTYDELLRNQSLYTKTEKNVEPMKIDKYKPVSDDDGYIKVKSEDELEKGQEVWLPKYRMYGTIHAIDGYYIYLKIDNEKSKMYYQDPIKSYYIPTLIRDGDILIKKDKKSDNLNENDYVLVNNRYELNKGDEILLKSNSYKGTAIFIGIKGDMMHIKTPNNEVDYNIDYIITNNMLYKKKQQHKQETQVSKEQKKGDLSDFVEFKVGDDIKVGDRVYNTVNEIFGTVESIDDTTKNGVKFVKIKIDDSKLIRRYLMMNGIFMVKRKDDEKENVEKEIKKYTPPPIHYKKLKAYDIKNLRHNDLVWDSEIYEKGYISSVIKRGGNAVSIEVTFDKPIKMGFIRKYDSFNSTNNSIYLLYKYENPQQMFYF